MRKTLTLIALVVLIGAGSAAAQGTYSIDTNQSNVGF